MRGSMSTRPGGGGSAEVGIGVTVACGVGFGRVGGVLAQANESSSGIVVRRRSARRDTRACSVAEGVRLRGFTACRLFPTMGLT